MTSPVGQYVATVRARLDVDTTSARRTISREFMSSGAGAGREFSRSFNSNLRLPDKLNLGVGVQLRPADWANRIQREIDSHRFVVGASIELTNVDATQTELDRITRDRTIDVRINQVGAPNPGPVLGGGAAGAVQGGSLTTFDFSAAGVAIKTALIAGAVLAAPFVASALGAGILASPVIGGIGAGIALQFQDPAIKRAGQLMVNDLKDKFVSASAGIRGPLLDAMDSVGDRIDGLLPNFQRMFTQAGRYIGPIVDGFGDMLDIVVPAIEDAFRNSAPVMQALADSLPTLGEGIADMFDAVGENAEDIALGIRVISDTVADTLMIAGESIGWIASRVRTILDIVGLVATGLSVLNRDSLFGDENTAAMWEGLARAVSDYSDAADEANTKSRNLIYTGDGVTSSVQNQVGAIDQVVDKYLELGDKANDSGERIKFLKETGEQFAGTQGPLGETTQIVADALYAEANAAGTAKDKVDLLKAAHEVLTGTNRSMIDAQETFNLSLFTLDERLSKTSNSLSINSAEGIKNRDVLQDMLRKNEGLYFAIQANGGVITDSAGRTRTANEVYEANIQKLIRQARAAGLSEKEIAELVKEQGKIKEKNELSYKTKGFDVVLQELKTVADAQLALATGIDSKAELDGFKNRLDYPSGSSPSQRRAQGGFISGPGGPTDDKIPAWLSNGEFVQQASAVNKYGTNFMSAINDGEVPEELIKLVLGYAKGGVAKAFASGGLVWPFPIDMSKTKTKFETPMDGGPLGTDTGQQSWQWLATVLNARFGTNFGRRQADPGRRSRTLTGNVSYHTRGRAIDIPPRREYAEWIRSSYGAKTRELISPWNELNLHNGRPHRYTGAVWNQHNFAGGNAHVHWAYAKGGLVKLPANLRKLMNAEEENAVLAALNNNTNARQKEIISGLSTSEILEVRKAFGSKFNNVYKYLNNTQKIALDTQLSQSTMRTIPGLTGAERNALTDAINSGTISVNNRRIVQKLTPQEIITIAGRLSYDSLTRLRPFLTPVQQAALDSARGQRTSDDKIRSGLSSAIQSAVMQSASGKKLSANQKKLLAGMSSQQIQAFRDTMTGKQWSNLMADLSPSQRRDVNTRLTQEKASRDKAVNDAIKNSKPTTTAPDPNQTIQDLTKLTMELRALASKPSVVFSGPIGSNTNLAAAYQQASFWSRASGG